MYDFKWSDSEKKLSRRVFDAALQAELAEIVADFKAKASAITTAREMWPLEQFLAQSAREIDRKYDYRYSRLIGVFATLLREGRISEEQLQGLSEEKRCCIRRLASL
ncbi:hypothetical protein [Pseudoxanthomonas wuyuanensis]|uniref:Uncharacterized protein n=1 Tax=Pseudoxanthomonas wuyuanensis TaxID=1073196 RepID=A0A286D3A8_9GAMM|nr:hypothetical protein [Pseudoxanthomonas wuyuanensis]KAF1722975.1 hypothetical protein CSC75_00340 [Pseudoxanthomonas wuyuanensis]SOD53158.1 hypothetical protein SAMN06296416_102268 [Pseudoxanthomonas wuyuanensis]